MKRATILGLLLGLLGWVANARGTNPACDQPYTHYNLLELLREPSSK